MDLTDAYENAAYIAGAQDFVTQWPISAERFRAALGERFVGGFDPDHRRGVDLVRLEGPAKGLFVFVHGGYWMRFSPRDWTHLAAGAVRQGWAVAMPGYPLAPTVRVAEITRRVAQEVSHLAAQHEGEIVLAGHSAGGHLVSRMLSPGVLPREVLDRVTRVVPVSPLSNLSPLLRTKLNETLQLTPDEVQKESPVTQPRPDTKIQVWVGAEERPAFLDQARWLSEAWDVPCHVVPNTHHFDIVTALEDPSSDLLRWALADS